MRPMVVALFLGLCASTAAAASGPLTYEELLGRVLDDPARLRRGAELAHLESSVAATGRFTREGPELAAELGPRRLADGATKLEATARFEVPLLSDRGTREVADRSLRELSPDLVAAEAVESRLRLRAAFLAAWFAQERLAVIEAQLEATDRIAVAVRDRVARGDDAAYEVALVEGEGLRLRSESDGARAARGEAWAELGALATLPPEPLPIASPGLPRIELRDDAASRFAAGALMRAVDRGRRLGLAFVDFEQAQRRSRWAIAGSVGSEGDESFATLGAAYRFPRRGESNALRAERDAVGRALARESESDAVRLATRFQTAIDRANRFEPITPPDAFDDALGAVALRMELGKERASQALPVRRQILEARLSALQRIRDAHLLNAELEALTAGEAP